MVLSKVIKSRYLAVLLLIPKIASVLSQPSTYNLVARDDVASYSLRTYKDLSHATLGSYCR